MKVLSTFVAVLLFTLPFIAKAQVEVDRSKHDFGQITRQTNRVVDFTFTNTGEHKAFILRSDFPGEFNILFSDREILPDSSITLRVKFNPLYKEAVDFKVPIYFSSMPEPIELLFKGEVSYIDMADNPACPSFEESAMAGSGSFETEFLVVNKISGEPIKSASVRLIERGKVVKTLTTDKDGRVFEEVPIKYFYVLAQSDYYKDDDTTTWINRRNTFFKFELDPLEREEEDIFASEGRPVNTVENEPDAFPVRLEEADTVELLSETHGEVDFSESEYAHNNLVFLIDVSSSMNRSGRLDMLKAAMLELVDMLRDVDKLTVMTYAADTDQILPPTYVTNKEEVEELIRNITAEGYTSGNKAVNRAFESAAANYISGGNNQVILATDGVFRSSDVRRIKSTIGKYVKQNISLSIIGLKSSEESALSLLEYTKLGGGSFIPINHFDQGGAAIRRAIRQQSLIK